MGNVYNPYLPGWEYIPDGEPHVFDGRLYIYGSHDQAGGKGFCLNDYVCWSAPEEDLSSWRYEGVIYRREQHPHEGAVSVLYAPDVVKGTDGCYYLYYSAENCSYISVAVCDTPAGQYKYLGDVRTADGHVLGTNQEDWFQFDPAVLVDEDGRIWLYSGSGQKVNRKFGHPVVGCFVMELEQDMLTVKNGPKVILEADESLKKPSFFEGASIRHIGDWYYLVYPATNMTGLNYAMSRYPDRGFKHKGPIHSTSDIGLEGRKLMQARFPIGNNHGGMVRVKGQWYIFDHRMTNRSMFSRQGVAEPIMIKEDGTIDMVEATSCGLNGGPLQGKGNYPAYIACNLMCGKFLKWRNPFSAPYVTQDETDYCPEREKQFTEKKIAGADIDSLQNWKNAPMPYVAGIRNNTLVGYKYFDFQDVHSIGVEIRGDAKGILFVQTQEEGSVVARIPIGIHAETWRAVSVPIHITRGVHAVYFRYKGKGNLAIRRFGFK